MKTLKMLLLCLLFVINVSALELFGIPNWKSCSTYGENEVCYHPMKNFVYKSYGDWINVYDMDNCSFVKQLVPGNGCKSINCLVIDNKGNLWLATEIGLIRYNETTDTWKVYGIADGLVSSVISKVRFNSVNNQLVVSAYFGGTKQGIGITTLDVSGNPGAWSNTLAEYQIFDIAVFGNETWALSPLNIFRVNGTTLVSYDSINSMVKNPVSIHIDMDGNVWAGCNRGNLAKFDRKNQAWSMVTVNGGFDPAAGIDQIILDNNKILWLETENLLIKIDTKLPSLTAEKFNRVDYDLLSTVCEVPLCLNNKNGLLISGVTAIVMQAGTNSIFNPFVKKTPSNGVVNSQAIGYFSANGKMIAKNNNLSSKSAGVYFSLSPANSSLKVKKVIMEK